MRRRQALIKRIIYKNTWFEIGIHFFKVGHNSVEEKKETQKPSSQNIAFILTRISGRRDIYSFIS